MSKPHKHKEMSIKKAYYPQSSTCTGINGNPITPESWNDFVSNRSSLYSWQTDEDNIPYIERTFPSEAIANGDTLQEVYGGNTINVVSVLQGSDFWLGPKPHRPF